MKPFFLMLLLLSGITLLADRNKQAIKALEKGEYSEVEAQLFKSLEKDPVNPGANYIYSLLFTTVGYTGYDIDTAYYFIFQAKQDYSQADDKVLKELEKNLIGPNDFANQQSRIEALAYERASGENSILGYEYFMKNFNEAEQIPDAISKRNELVFVQVQNSNDWKRHKEFVENYPDAAQVPLAEKEYQRLLYLDQTNDGKLSSLQSFLEEYPENEHRTKTERKVLEISVGLNRIEDYLDFMSNYPNSSWNFEITNRLFHLDKDFFDLQYFDYYSAQQSAKDSLLEVLKLSQIPVLPIYENGLYGFMNVQGDVILQPAYGYIKEEYLCGNIQSDILEVREQGKLKLINYGGAAAYVGGFDATTDLGGGFVKLRKNGRYAVWHKSGIDVLPALYEDIELLGSNLLKVKSNGLWGIFSVFGNQLLEEVFEDIYLINDYWVFQKDGLLAVTNLDRLEPLTDGEEISLSYDYDEVELVKEKYLLCYSGDFESLLNEDLDVIINSSDQTIIPMLDNWMVKRDSGYSYFHEENETFLEESFRDISFSKNWFGFKRDTTWTLLSEGFGFEPKFELDSVHVLNDKMAYYQKGDTARLVFYPNRLVELKQEDQIQLVGTPGTYDSTQYLLIKNEDVIRVYSENGEFRFNSKYDNIDYISSGYFSYESRGKKGILTKNGSVILKAEYDGVGQVIDSIAPLLQKGKFGYYNLFKEEIIQPNYLKKIENYSPIHRIALKEDGYGFMDLDGQEISIFSFSEIEFWNDSVALTKTEDFWSLYSITEEQSVVEGILRIDYIYKGDDETIAYFLTEKGFGVFSNVRGEVLSPSFNSIINLGSDKKPIFFAEKHVPEADFYVVVYANDQGETIRSQAFRAEEYEWILCDE